MPSHAAFLKNGKQKQKTDENKNEEPERWWDINNNKTNNQCHPNEQAHHARYKNNKVQPYHWEVTKKNQVTSILINGDGVNNHLIAELVHEIQQVTLAIEHLQKYLDQLLTQNYIHLKT